MAYSELEPFDEERGDIRAAQVTTMLANVNRDSKKRREPYGIRDFVLRFGDTPKVVVEKNQTWEDQKRIGKMIFQMYGKKKSPPTPRVPRTKRRKA